MARKKKQFLQVVVKSAKRLPAAKQSKSALKPKARASANTRSGASTNQTVTPTRAQSGKKATPTPMKQSPRITTVKASKSPVATTSSSTPEKQSMEMPTKVAVIAVPRLNISPFKAKSAGKKTSLIHVGTRPLVPKKTTPEEATPSQVELDSVQCQDCFLQLPTPQDLAKHKQVCVRRSFSRIFSCHTCLTCFCTQDELNEHCATQHGVKESPKTTRLSTPKQNGTARQKRVPVYAKESREQIKVLRVPPGVNPEDAIMRTYGVKPSQIIYKNPSGKSPTTTSSPPPKRMPESKEGTTVISVVRSPVKGKLTNPSRKTVEATKEKAGDEEATGKSEEPDPPAVATPSPVVTRTRSKQDNAEQSSVAATKRSPRKGQNPNQPQGSKSGKTSNSAASTKPVASPPKRSTRSTAGSKTLEPKKKAQVQPAEDTAEKALEEDSPSVKRSARVRAREAAGAVVAPWRKLIKGTSPSAAKNIKPEPEEKKSSKPTEETPAPRTRSSPRKQERQVADQEESPKKRARTDEASQESKPDGQKQAEATATTTTSSSIQVQVKASSETESQQQERLLGELHLVKISDTAVQKTAKDKSAGKKTVEVQVAVKRPIDSQGQKASPTKKLKASASPVRPAICIPNRAKKWNIHRDAQVDNTSDNKSDSPNTAKFVRILPKPTPCGQVQIATPVSNKSLNTIPCLACGLRFQSAPTLAAHRRYRCKVMLAEKAGHSYTCGCGLKFPTMAELKEHNELERQEGRYPRSEKNRARMVCSCLDCGEQFHRSQLAAHKRECGKLLNIYTKTFACNYCTSFKTSSAQQLKEHIAAYHPSEPVPLYPMFSTPDSEALGKNKPKMCLDCGETFPHDRFLVHKRDGCSQEGKSMIYSCFDCHKMFQTRRELEAHKKAVHQVSGEGYMCGWCRESFRLYIDLRLHYERKHSRVVRVPQTQIDSYLQAQLHSQRNPGGPSGPVNFTSRVPGGSGGQGFQISIDTSNPGGPAIRVNPTGQKTEDVSAKLMESERSILKELKSKQSSAAKASDKDEAKESEKDAAKKAAKKEEPAVKHRPAILRRKAAQKSATTNAAGKGAAKKPRGQAAAAAATAAGTLKTASQKLDKGFVTVPNLPGVRMLVPVAKGQMVCLQCQTTLQSVEDIASHKCPQTGKKVMVKAEATSPEKKEWNLKPVPAVESASDKVKGAGEEAETEGGEDVEWFVASSE